MKRTFHFGKLVLLACLFILTAVFMAGCKKGTENSRLLTAKVGDSKLFLDEVMYFIWQMEKESASYEEYFKENNNADFWEQDAGNGDTVRAQLKQDVLDSAVRNEILYNKAVEEGYVLTDGEKDNIKRKAKEQFEELSEEQRQFTGITEKLLYAHNEKELLVSHYFTDVTDRYTDEKEKAAEEIRREDYRQINVETLSIPTLRYKEDGTEEALTGEEKAAVYNVLLEQLDAAKAAPTLKELVDDDQSLLEHEEFGFIVGDETCDPIVEETAAALSDGQTSAIVETSNSYMIVRVVNSNSADGYQEAVDSAVMNAEYQAFDKFYEDLEDQVVIEINHEVWDEVSIGNTIIKDK